jgi:translation elongation factor EF-4
MILAREVVRPLRKTFWRSATGGISHGKESSSRSRRKQAAHERLGKVEIPQEAFLAILKSNSRE